MAIKQKCYFNQTQKEKSDIPTLARSAGDYAKVQDIMRPNQVFKW